MPTPPTTGHVILDGTPLIVEPGSYSKGPNQLYGASPLRLDSPISLSPVSTFKQDSFKGGMGQEHFRDSEMYYLGDADTRRGWAQAKFKLSRAAGALSDNSDKSFAIRPIGSSKHPHLYSFAKGSRFLYRQDNLNGTRVQAFAAVHPKTITAIGRSFYGSQYGLHIGLSNGDLWAIGSGHEAPDKKPRITTIDSAVTFLDSLGARGDIAGIANGQLYKTTSGTWTKFHTVDMPVYDGEAWNQRMWIIGHDGAGRSALYVTDTITTQEVYRWSAAFVAQSITLHSGQLYILGYTRDDEFENALGQVWSYNGSSMRLVFEVPEDIWRVSGFTTNYIQGAFPYKQWLAFGMGHKGVWVYDPEQDAIHPVAQLEGVANDNSDYVTAVANYGGRLVAANFNESQFHFEASPKRYWPSYLMTSEYDANFPGQDKTWIRVRVRLKEPLPNGCSVQVLYTTDHIEKDITTGPTWKNAGVFATPGQTLFTAELPGDPIVSQVIRFQLKLTPSPWQGIKPAPGHPIGDNLTPKVASLECDYLLVPDVKYGWSFRVLGTANYSRPDGQPYGITVGQLQVALDNIQRNSAKRWVTFIDEDGKTYKVQVLDVRIFKPVVGNHNNPDGEFATWAVNLAEV